MLRYGRHRLRGADLGSAVPFVTGLDGDGGDGTAWRDSRDSLTQGVGLVHIYPQSGVTSSLKIPKIPTNIYIYIHHNDI